MQEVVSLPRLVIMMYPVSTDFARLASGTIPETNTLNFRRQRWHVIAATMFESQNQHRSTLHAVAGRTMVKEKDDGNPDF
jgi:hypothetical protein